MFNLNDHLQGLRSTIIGLVLLLATTIIGFVWISIGLYHWLTNCLGAVWGPIVLGLVCFLPIVIFAFMKAFVRAPLSSTPLSSEQGDASLIFMSKIQESLSGKPPFFVVSAAVIAGFLATRFPSLLTIFTQVMAAYAEETKANAAKEPAQSGETDPQASKE